MTPSGNGGIEQEIFKAFEHYGKTHPGTLYVYMATEDGGILNSSSKISESVSQLKEMASRLNGIVGTFKV